MGNLRNNPWEMLSNPLASRPGTPQPAPSPAPRRAEPPAAPRPPHNPDRSMPAESVAQAHMDPETLPWGLTARQMQVLDMLVQGMSLNTISVELKVTNSDVYQIAEKLRKKIGVQTNAQAVVAWHRHYRVLHPDSELGNKDNILLANLRRACAAYTDSKKEAA